MSQDNKTVTRRRKPSTSPFSSGPEWNSYRAMKERCGNPQYHAYPRYGGRGIAICAEWAQSNGFRTFLRDMGSKPTVKHSLDRIDTDKDYFPGNCRWATHTEQMNNRSSNRLITAHGREQTLAQWCAETGMDRGVVVDRLRRGVSAEMALSVGSKVVTGRIGRPPRQRK